MLEVKDLICGYDARFILKNINLKVKDKELVGIIGPNGSGKTTLLRAMTKVLRPRKGEVLFEGKNIWQMKFKELAMKVAFVSQSPEIGFNMTIEEFILLGRIPHYGRFQFLEDRHDEEIAKKYMALTDTLRFKNRLTREISGGERQLVVIARALTQQPKLLLLDEPTAHLDITHQVRILDLIKRLNRELELTVITVLHDLNLASEYCHRLILLKEGEIFASGTPKEVLTYQNIEEVYKTLVVVEANPVSAKPYVLLVSEEERQKRKS